MELKVRIRFLLTPVPIFIFSKVNTVLEHSHKLWFSCKFLTGPNSYRSCRNHNDWCTSSPPYCTVQTLFPSTEPFTNLILKYFFFGILCMHRPADSEHCLLTLRPCLLPNGLQELTKTHTPDIDITLIYELRFLTPSRSFSTHFFSNAFFSLLAQWDHLATHALDIAASFLF